MNEPITNQQDEVLFFEQDNSERTVGLKRFSENWKDILQECADKDIYLSQRLQAEYPVATMDGEPQSALGSFMQLANVNLTDDKANGIYSTPMKEIAQSPWKKALALEGWKQGVRGNLKGYRDDEIVQALAGPASSADYAQGTSVHPRMYLPLRDSARMTAFPPLSAVASQVTLQNGQLIIPEFKENEQGPGPHPWVDGDEINLDVARISERPTVPKAVAGGFRVTDALWMSPIGASFVTIQASRYRVRVERILVKELLGKVAIRVAAEKAKTGTDPTRKVKNVGLTANSDGVYPASVLTKIAMLYSGETEKDESDFMVTTLLGNDDTVEKYLDIDRSGHFTNSGMRNVQGNVAGWDTYGKMPSDRMVYNIRDDQIPGYSLIDDELVAIDAMETGSVYILEDTSRESMADLERSTNFSYTLKYVTILNQEDGEPLRLLTGA